MGLSSKASSASNICLKDKNKIVFNDTKKCSIFKSFFSNLAQSLVSKLPPSPNVFTESKVTSYYDNVKFKDLDFEFFETSYEKVLNILKGLKGTGGQSNDFCLKESFFVIKENDIYKKFQKFTCKPQLTYFVCLFPCMTSLTQRFCLIVQKHHKTLLQEVLSPQK